MKDYISRSNFIDGTMNAVGNYFVLRSPEAEDIQNPSASKFEPSSRLLTKQELGGSADESPRAYVVSQSLWLQDLGKGKCRWYCSSFYNQDSPLLICVGFHSDTIGTPSIKHARKQSECVIVEYLNTKGQKVEIGARSFTLVRMSYTTRLQG